MTYAIYALCMYFAANYSKAGGVAILGGVLLGIGAGLFWTAQGALMMAYSTPSNRGLYISLFWIVFNLGGMIGGLLQFALNYKTEQNKANAASYFTFVALMAAASIGSLFFVLPPKKVRKEDGTMVVFEEGSDWKREIKGSLKASVNPNMLLLSVLFISSNFFYTYQFNFVNGSLFTMRTRGLNSALYWMAQMVAAYVIGLLLDRRGATKRSRGVAAWLFVLLSFGLAWACGVWLQYGFEGGYDKPDVTAKRIRHVDFKESKRAAFPIIIYLLYGFADAAIQAFAYWIMGALAGNDTAMSARFAGFYKGIQSAGAAVAWGIDLKILYHIQMWIGFALFAIGMPLAFVTVRRLPDVIEADDSTQNPRMQTSLSLLNTTAEGAASGSFTLHGKNSRQGSLRTSSANV